MGVDHTSGTETTDQPQPSSEKPPPDRPGSPGRPSRQESWTAASTPTETTPQTSDETNEDEPSTEQPDARTPEPPEPEADDDGEPPGTPRADSWTRARETQQSDTGERRAEDLQEPAESAGEQPGEPPEPGRGPRAESWARAAEAQSTAAGSETAETDAPAPATIENGERVAALPADRAFDSDPNAPDRPDEQAAGTDGQDMPGQESRPGTDDAEPLFPDREPAAGDGGEAEPGTGETKAKSTETGEPRTEPRPGTETPPEPDREAAEQTDEGTGNAEPSAPDAEQTPESGRQAGDHDDPQPSSEDAERPDEIADGPGDANNARGRNSENQPASPAPEETETDQFAGLPTRADLDPASAGELTAERGEPLAPVNENQDLSESDDAEKMRHILRRNRENPDDAQRNLNNLSSNMDELFERPPSGNAVSMQDTSNRGGQLQGDQQPGVQGGSVVYAALGIAMVAWKLHETLTGWARERGGRDDNSHR
ncbi:hypothetical protein [Actinomadura sp. 3N508]|uniref:hypothetical protein n=1 Tax=Actinomadura sp. 3N508 TaxID=3375153 RepID=UPI0037B93C02